MPSIIVNETEYDSTTLLSLGREVRIDLMVDWFLENFEEPGNKLPYDPEEGKHDWSEGGPFDAKDEIDGAFSETAPVDEIDHAVGIVERRGGFEWARRDTRPLPVNVRSAFGFAALSMDASVMQQPALILTIGTENYNSEAFRTLKPAKRIVLIVEWFEDRHEVAPVDFHDRSVLSGERELSLFFQRDLFGYADDDDVSIAVQILLKQGGRWRPRLLGSFGRSTFSPAFQISEARAPASTRRIDRAGRIAQQYFTSRDASLEAVDRLARALRDIANRGHNMPPELIDAVTEQAPETLLAAERVLGELRNPEPRIEELASDLRSFKRMTLMITVIATVGKSIVDAAVGNHYPQLEKLLTEAMQSVGQFIGMI